MPGERATAVDGTVQEDVDLSARDISMDAYLSRRHLARRCGGMAAPGVGGLSARPRAVYLGTCAGCRRLGLPGPDSPRARDLRDASTPTTHALRHGLDRKSTRLNSSHSQISYAVFC